MPPGPHAASCVQRRCCPAGMFQDLDASRARQQRGRITLYCPGDSFDRKKLDEVRHMQ